ncbi:MAG TPA: divalent-cation tolerance protein CutA [Candidatus Acidoferrales bacterium]|jgi:periplasmic divalent cation tolerance protein|nr:divalent-cation tolerance protein CutA [Candidatus Acidoferrales bacterium]
MPRKEEAIVVLVTCASVVEARRIAESVVNKRLAACGNVCSSAVNSIYRWKGKVEKATEVLLILKSTRKVFAELEREVRRLHSYKIPEIIALSVVAGSRSYLQWVQESVR